MATDHCYEHGEEGIGMSVPHYDSTEDKRCKVVPICLASSPFVGRYLELPCPKNELMAAQYNNVPVILTRLFRSINRYGSRKVAH